MFTIPRDRFPTPSCLLASLLLGLVLLPNLPGQRGIRQLTKAAQAHYDAKISPDGLWAAFRGSVTGQPGSIGIVGTGVGSSQANLVQSSNLGDFFWSPASTGLYYVDGTEVRFISRIGGQSSLIDTISGASVRIWCIDPQGKTIFGTRLDTTTKNNSIFSLAANGSTKAKDIITGFNYMVLDQVAVDPSGTKIAYRSTQPVPHSPIELMMADADGKNQSSLTGTGISNLATNLVWVDAGKTLVFTYADVNSGTWQLARIKLGSTTIEPMTAKPTNHRQSGIAGDLSWLVFEAESSFNKFVPAVMPAAGGARVLLEPESGWLFQGAPTMDSAGQKVTFAASPASGTATHVYLAELDRELRIFPLPEIGKSLTLSLPVAQGERGMVYVSLGLIPSIFPLPGFTYGVAIDPLLMVPLLSGVGAGGGVPLSYTGTLPNSPAIVGAVLYFQGLRIVNLNPDQGDLTRYAELQIF